MPEFYNKQTEDPQALTDKLTSIVGVLNRANPRCSAMRVDCLPKGSFRGYPGPVTGAAGPDSLQQAKIEQGQKHGWRITISGLVELELLPIEGTLCYTKADEASVSGSANQIKIQSAEAGQQIGLFS